MNVNLAIQKQTTQILEDAQHIVSSWKLWNMKIRQITID